MNFVIKFLKRKGCDAILMIIDQLVKIKHYIAYKINKEETSIEQTAQMYIKHI